MSDHVLASFSATMRGPVALCSAVTLTGMTLACGGFSPEPTGTAIPTVTDDQIGWTDADGVWFTEPIFSSIEPRETGLAVAYIPDRGWVTVDLDVRPIVVEDLSCNPNLDEAQQCGDQGRRSGGPSIELTGCAMEVRETGTTEMVPGPRREDGSYIIVEAPVRELWLTLPSGREIQAMDSTDTHDCIGDLTLTQMTMNGEPGPFGLFRGDQEVVSPYAHSAQKLTEHLVIMADRWNDPWTLYNDEGTPFLHGLKAVRVRPPVSVPWGIHREFVVTTDGFAAERDGTCGWLSPEGTIIGGFEPGYTNCSTPRDGHGFANTPDGYQWIALSTSPVPPL